MSNRSPIKTRLVAGKSRLVIDFFYLDRNGRRRRYRKDATAQTRTGARAEAQRLIELAARTGSPDPSSGVPTFGAFVNDVFRPVIEPRLRAGTRRRYEDLFRQGVLGHFQRKGLDEIDWVCL